MRISNRWPSSREELNAHLRKTLGFDDAKRILPFTLPAIGFHNESTGSEPATRGTTRFGGRPDLPSGLEWPEGPDGPLAFVAQIILKEVAPLDIDQVLSPNGMLLFFNNFPNSAWGFWPEDRQRFAILFWDLVGKLERRDFPAKMIHDNRLVPLNVKPYLRWEIPTADPLARELVGFGDVPRYGDPSEDTFNSAYWSLDDALAKPHIPVGSHQLLGWANGIYQQGEDCRHICALARRNFPPEKSPAHIAALADRHEWRCLLQIKDPDDDGTIAYMIRVEDLARRNFQDCWCVYSNT